jgi:preprotein translocase subunit YajC
MTTAHAADLALAGFGAPGGQGGPGAVVTQIVFFAAIFAIFYFLLIRPQQRQRKERERLLSALKRGDRVVTTGGMHGTITGLTEHTVTLRVADQVRLEFDRGAIGRVVVEGTAEKDA